MLSKQGFPIVGLAVSAKAESRTYSAFLRMNNAQSQRGDSK